MIYIKEKAGEESTFPLEAALLDYQGVFIPEGDITSITWTLSDVDGNIINSRKDVVIAAITNPVTAVLFGDDLVVLAGDSDNQYKRRFTMKYVFDSEFGTGQPQNEEAEFQIDPFVNVPSLP